jgi:exosortase A
VSAVLASARQFPAVWWRALAMLAALLVAILMLYRGTALAVMHVWETVATFNHGYAVIPIALWLVWRKRHILISQVPSPAPGWLVPMAAAGLLWLVGELAIANAATHFSVVALLVFAVPLVLGNAIGRTILFPLAFVFFAVPIGDFLMPPMMVWTADFTVWALRATGIPVFREGEQLVIPSGHWSVVEACSGIRYLMSSVMVGALFAYLNYRSLRRRVLFMLVAIAVPVVANWLRAYLIVLTGHLTNNQIAVGADHLVYGWVFFGIVVSIMFAIGIRWAEPEADVPLPITRRGALDTRLGSAWVAGAAALAVLSAPALALRSLDASMSSATPVLPAKLAVPAGWSDAAPPFARWSPAFKGAAAQRSFGFIAPDGQAVGLYVGYWRQQEGHHKLVSSENVIAGSEDALWRRIAQGELSVDAEAQSTRLRAETWRGSIFADTNGAPRMRTAQIYWINGTLTASAWQSKLWGGWHKLLGRGDDAAVLVFYTPLADGSDADTRLVQAVQALLPGMSRALQKVRDVD